MSQRRSASAGAASSLVTLSPARAPSLRAQLPCLPELGARAPQTPPPLPPPHTRSRRAAAALRPRPPHAR
jgi:hypothetical protein